MIPGYDRWLTTDPRERAHIACACCGLDTHPADADEHGVCDECRAAARGSDVALAWELAWSPDAELAADAEYAAVCDAHRDAWVECCDAECAADEVPGEWRNAVVCTG